MHRCSGQPIALLGEGLLCAPEAGPKRLHEGREDVVDYLLTDTNGT